MYFGTVQNSSMLHRVHNYLPFSFPWEIESESHSVSLTLCNPMVYTVYGILQARILERVAFPFSRGSSQPQGSNTGLLRCGPVLYQQSHKGSPRVLGWVAYPFSRGSSWPKNWTRVSCIAGRFFINWTIREALMMLNCSMPHTAYL